MPGRLARRFLGGSLVLALSACATAARAGSRGHAPAEPRDPGAGRPRSDAGRADPGPGAGSPRQQLAVGHRDRAQRLERAGELRQALDEWKIALTIDPADAAAQARRRQIEARLGDQSASGSARAGRRWPRATTWRRGGTFWRCSPWTRRTRSRFSALQDDVKEIRFVPHTVKAGETLATIAERYYGDRAGRR